MGVTFLTPYDSLFALAAVLPIAALVLARRRVAAVRRLFSLPQPSRRGLAAGVVALALVPALVGVAAAQPVVVRQTPYVQRGDAQAFVVFDTSLSMTARAAPSAPTRLDRAKQEALKLMPLLGDIPVGVASMTDRTLPIVMPTSDVGLFDRSVLQSVAIDRPPPSQYYKGRATTFTAIASMGQAAFFPPGVSHGVLVVFTDGESSHLPTDFRLTIRQTSALVPFFVHVSAPGEHVYVKGKVDKRYVEDPESGTALDSFARLLNGRVFREGDVGGLAAAIRAATGHATSHTSVTEYARVALAPWFVLGVIAPLAFLLYRRNL